MDGWMDSIASGLIWTECECIEFYTEKKTDRFLPVSNGRTDQLFKLHNLLSRNLRYCSGTPWVVTNTTAQVLY
jgi:hypothetical protein